jgi:hypothetical protein
MYDSRQQCIKRWEYHCSFRTDRKRESQLFTSSARISGNKVRRDLPFRILFSPNLRNRAEIVRWVSENKRPFKIVSDRGFKSLIKTGRPEYRPPSPQTVSRDVKHVFARVRKCIAKMLKVSIHLPHKYPDLIFSRSMMVLLVSRPMLGPHQTAELLSQ